MAAIASSTSIPLAPTTTRWSLLRKAQLLEASTKGSGVKTIKVTPISCTSPRVPACLPKCLHENAWPISWKTFTKRRAVYNSGRFLGASTPEAWRVSSPICPPTAHSPAPKIPTQMRKPYPVNNLPIRPTQVSRKRSGSHNGIRMKRRLVRKPVTSRRIRPW